MEVDLIQQVTIYSNVIFLGDATPSPNSYSLPSLIGPKVPNKYSSSSYSMTARAKTGGFSEDLAKTPGPGRYNTTQPDTFKHKSACYSMLSRSYMPGGRTFYFGMFNIKKKSRFSNILDQN
jgi:hypothetical protein